MIAFANVGMLLLNLLSTYIKAGFFHGGRKQGIYTIEKALRECGIIMTQFNFRDPRKSTPGSAEIDVAFRKYHRPKKQRNECRRKKEKERSMSKTTKMVTEAILELKKLL